MSFLSRFRSNRPPYLVDPAVLAAMSAEVELPELPRRVAIPGVVDLVRVLDWPADAEQPRADYDWSDPGTLH